VAAQEQGKEAVHSEQLYFKFSILISELTSFLFPPIKWASFFTL